MFGKTFPDEKKEGENHEDKIIEEQKLDNFGESIDLRFDRYVKLKEYKNSFDIVKMILNTIINLRINKIMFLIF